MLDLLESFIGLLCQGILGQFYCQPFSKYGEIKVPKYT
ncbi:hypothetical protein LEP1GSC050_3520 [Leptospira broomii serovar Hurstbridge str. 5399]|uniref:Uncharacterized protein n=1 Tax=Leptospira broomii serovar Hurstbridge str. 5399 TaxID=1049789 RepID=T0GF06_9LEPT|nr:hypothetical protein LEP1GSC050_3520 [Leptospira broomii serovar Hurstbridge str. 5399]